MNARAPFLKQISDWLTRQQEKDFSNYVFIFPNKRSGLFFRYYLSQSIQKPVWSPQITDILGFVESLSDLQTADKHSLLFDLYDIYKAVMKEKGFTAENFDAFYPWGKILLDDFNEIDKYLANAEEVFQNVKDLKQLENYFDYLEAGQIEAIASFWEHVQSSRQSDEKEQFLKMWEVLFDIYSRFRKKLLDDQNVYEGLIYRNVYNKIQNQEIAGSGKTYAFCGFNLLTRSEEGIFDFFQQTDQALFFWDACKELLQKPGFLPMDAIRENIEKFPAPGSFELTPLNHGLEKANIQMLGCALEAGQAKVAGDLLSKLQGQDDQMDIDETAVILPAEHMLMPLLHSLPDTVKEVNITMGYALRETQLASLLELLTGLQKHKKASANSVVYYHREVVSILKHPYVNQSGKEDIDGFVKKLLKTNQVYISDKGLTGLNDLCKKIFNPEIRQIRFDYYIDILLELYHFFEPREKAFETEFIFSLYQEFNRLKEVIREKQLEISDEVFYNLIRESIHSIRIPFSGEPLRGLQVMGSLETRCLDFRNMIILSMNEGKWPKTATSNSFIPYGIRKAFKLPTFEQDDQVYAYYFYRLLTRAENIYLLYNSETGYMGEGEVSRYLNQLKYDFNCRIEEQTLGHSIQSSGDKAIVHDKKGRAGEILQNYLNGKQSLYPAAINTFIDCSLKFYFKYILKLREEETVEEDVDALVFGNILHHSLELIYSQLTDKGQKIDQEKLEQAHKIMDDCILEAFAGHFHTEKDKFQYEGQQLIIKNTIRQYLKNVLETDQGIVPFDVISLESKGLPLSYQADIKVNGQMSKVQLSGIIDRVDRVGGKLRVIDYKSGSDEKHFPGIAALFDRNLNSRNKAAMQTLLYGLMLKDQFPGEAVQPGLYDVRNMYGKHFDPRFAIKEGRGKAVFIDDIAVVETEFRNELQNVLEELFHPEMTFEQTEMTDHCRYCEFRGICHRD